MADFKIEAKRVKAGNALAQFEKTAMSAVNQLKTIKSQLVALKTAVNTDPDYTTEDETVVNQVISDLQAELATL